VALRPLRLVYLTWTTLFISKGRHSADRGNSLAYARISYAYKYALDQHPLRSSPHSARSNSDVCYFNYLK